METNIYKLNWLILIVVTQHKLSDCKYNSLEIISIENSNVIDIA